MRRRISATPFDQLSAFHWMPFGEQALPVRSEDDAEVEDDQPVARLRQALDRQRHAGIGDVEDRARAALVVPLPGDLEADVDLVLMVGDEKLDRLAEDLAAEILDRHARHLDGTRSCEIGVGTGLVVHDPDNESLVCARREGGARKEQAEKDGAQKHRGFLGLRVASSLAEPQGEDNGKLVGAFPLTVAKTDSAKRELFLYIFPIIRYDGFFSAASPVGDRKSDRPIAGICSRLDDRGYALSERGYRSARSKPPKGTLQRKLFPAQSVKKVAGKGA